MTGDIVTIQRNICNGNMSSSGNARRKAGNLTRETRKKVTRKKMTKDEAKAFSEAMTALQQIDGCQGCEFEGRNGAIYPCKFCCMQYPNKWEEKREKDV